VWFVHESASQKQAHVMKVCAVKKLQELFQGNGYISYKYQLEDSKGVLYDEGQWVAETTLEFCNG
jgi:hypothetical protein